MGITVADLRAAGLDDRFEAIDAAVEAHLDGAGGNVAVVSEPFAGRGALLDHVEDRLGAATRRITLDGVVRGGLPSLETHEVVLVDDCQYLYTREIGGFDRLDRFLRTVARSDAMFVTSWNRYAWSYLRTVRSVDRFFPRVVEVPTLDDEGVAALLRSNYEGDRPTFVETDESDRLKTVDLGRREFSVAGRTVRVPVPKLNAEYVTYRLLGDVEDDTQAVVFRKIATLSRGDPGVAVSLWERSVRDGEIAPAYVEEVDEPVELDHDAAFLLEVVLSKGRVSRAELDRIVRDGRVDEHLQALLRQGLVTVEPVPARGRPWLDADRDDDHETDLDGPVKAAVGGPVSEGTAAVDEFGVDVGVKVRPEAGDGTGGDGIGRRGGGTDGDGDGDRTDGDGRRGAADPATAAPTGRATPGTDDGGAASRTRSDAGADRRDGAAAADADAADGDAGPRRMVTIVPERLHASVRHLERRQLLW